VSLKDDIAAEPKAKSGPECMTCSWYNALDKATKTDFDDYVAQDDYCRALLFRVIRDKWNYPACDSSLKYHLHNHHGTR